ncbi:MAG TPA: hypothetical protein VLG74_16410, partial [Blastocatellia bacterium]|nr:hypothetical protein [Blastocatellia bacterium]
YRHTTTWLLAKQDKTDSRLANRISESRDIRAVEQLPCHLFLGKEPKLLELTATFDYSEPSHIKASQ